MRIVAMPVQGVVSAVNNANNPIDLVDWISSFLKMLSKFNSIVGEIATVCATLWCKSRSVYLSEV